MRVNGRGWKAWGRAALLTAVAAAAALWLAGRAPGDAPSKGEASELDALPIDGPAAFTVDIAALWNNPALKTARDRLAKEAPDYAERIAKEIGVAPDDVERATIVMQSVQGPPDSVFFLTTVKPYDAKKVAAALAPDGKEATVNGHKMVAAAENQAVGFVTDRTFVRGSADAVRRVLQQVGGGKAGPLTGVVREAAAKHFYVTALDVEALAKSVPQDLPPDAAPFKALLKAKTAVLTVDLGDELKAKVRVAFEGESDAKQGEDAVNAALDLARSALVKQLELMEKEKELADLVGLMKEVQTGLRAAKVERTGSAIEVAGSVKIDAEKAGVALLDGVQKVREAAARIQSVNNLKQLALAMFNHESTYGHFPAQAVYDKDGKPLLSWRVMILPYIEQNELYKEFHLDEPWDSEHNKKLLDKMPKVFASPAQSAESLKNHETPYQGFAGKGAIFDGKQGIKIADITDGTSNTIMLAETAKTVPWTKPEDIPFDEGKLLPKVGGLFANIFNAAMCDGSVRSVSMAVKEATLRAAITRNGGEVLGPDW